jgi:predicted GNAT family N-acyltransferase
MNVTVCSYETHKDAMRAVRFEVFVDEQSVPAEIEMDDRDPLCVHVVAWDNGVPVGTGRIDLEKGGKVGRVAVLASYRRSGVGTRIMAALEDIARNAKLDGLWFHAQLSAIPFYEALGYIAEGPEFDEADIPHRTMRKAF